MDTKNAPLWQPPSASGKTPAVPERALRAGLRRASIFWGEKRKIGGGGETFLKKGFPSPSKPPPLLPKTFDVTQSLSAGGAGEKGLFH